MHIIAWKFFFNSGKCIRREKAAKTGLAFSRIARAENNLDTDAV